MQEQEIPQIFAAIAELQQTEGAMIPLTYIICQKRHMTRLFPGERGAGDRNGNVLPGNLHILFYLQLLQCYEAYSTRGVHVPLSAIQSGTKYVLQSLMWRCWFAQHGSAG